MSKRPFLKKRIDELEQIFKDSGAELLTLRALESELVHRSTPRAIHLLKAVRKSLALPQFIGKATEIRLFDPPARQPIDPRSPGPAGAQSVRTDFALRPPMTPSSAPVARSVPPAPKPAPRTEPIQFPAPAPEERLPNSGVDLSMSLEEAYKVLNVPIGADWETIEASRRIIVGRSNPALLKGVALEKRRILIEAAERANIAMQVLTASHPTARLTLAHEPEAVERAVERREQRVLQAVR